MKALMIIVFALIAFDLTTSLLDKSDVAAPYIDRYEEIEKENFHPDDPSGPSEAEHRGEAW